MIYFGIGLGGIIGALLRYGLSLVIPVVSVVDFPLATWITNMMGCCALGWLSARIIHNAQIPLWIRTGLGTGVIGSFTTFSTFSVEVVRLLHADLWMPALFYLLASAWGGWLSAWLGWRMGALQKEKKAVETT